MVSGCEWYHRDLKDRPLNYPWRFYIDVAVVTYTIVFLYASNNEGIWLFFAGHNLRSLRSLGYRCADRVWEGQHCTSRKDLVRIHHEYYLVGILLVAFPRQKRSSARNLFIRISRSSFSTSFGQLANTVSSHFLGRCGLEWLCWRTSGPLSLRCTACGLKQSPAQA